ncbi:restriction endonuclease subunit S [Streptomyces niveus]|uniref:restriction endonuclease subunit S n=1 Tax=Streptomyces niveus TaxID=193462 RepID=UPI0036BED308
MALTISPIDLVAEADRSDSPGLLSRHPSWERVPLGEIFDVLNGFAFKSQAFNQHGDGIPLIRIRDVGQSGTKTFYSGDFDDQYLVRSGEIIVGMDGDFRVASWSGPTALLNQRVCKISVRNTEHYDPRFLLHALQGYLDAIRHATSSVTVKHLSSRTVQEIPIPLPPLDEQRRIVETLEAQLSRLDSITRTLENTKAKSRSLRRAVVERATNGEMPVQLDSDEPVESLLAKIKHEISHLGTPKHQKNLITVGLTPYARHPSKWSVQPLGALCHSITYGTSSKAHADKKDGDVPVLRMGNIQDGLLTLENLKYLPKTNSDVDKIPLEDGDLLFNRTNSAELVGKSAVYYSTMGPATFASYLIRCRLGRGVEPEWVSLCINSPEGRRYIASVSAQQVGQANVNGTKLAAFPIPVPPHGEQLRILSSLRDWQETVDRTNSVTNGVLRSTAQLRRSLMRHAVTGQLVPQDPTDEPASVLLDRIRAEQAAAPKPQRTRRPRAAAAASAPAPTPAPAPRTAIQQEFQL